MWLLVLLQTQPLSKTILSPRAYLPLIYPMAPRSRAETSVSRLSLTYTQRMPLSGLVEWFLCHCWSTGVLQISWTLSLLPLLFMPLSFHSGHTLLLILIFAMKRIQLFLSLFLTPRVTQFFRFVNHSLKLFKVDSLGPGAEYICHLLHHHAQERTHEPWLLLSQSEFLVGQSPFAKWTSPVFSIQSVNFSDPHILRDHSDDQFHDFSSTCFPKTLGVLMETEHMRA